MSYPRRLHRSATRSFGEVAPIIDATTPGGVIRQVIDFMSRAESFRVGVPDTRFFPFSAICRLNLTFPSGRYHGTGFYVAPRLILTCGHNLFDKTPDSRGTEACSAITVRVGQQDATTWIGTFDLTDADFTPHPTWVSSAATDNGWDLGILRVPYDPPDGVHFTLINHSPPENAPLAVCGYGDDTGVDGQRQHMDVDRMRGLISNFEELTYNLQTRGGNSGSPVIAYFDNAASELPQNVPVMGVHTGAHGSQLNRGVLLTPDKIDWAMGGGNSSVTVFSLSNNGARRTMGGLPLALNGRPAVVGGLPLIAAPNRQPTASTQARPGVARSAGYPGWARPLGRSWIVIDQSASGGMGVARRTFGHPAHDLSGRTTLDVRVPDMPAGGSVRWNIPDSTHQARAVFELGSSTDVSAGGTSVRLRAVAPGPIAVDCMVKDSGGTTVESNKYWLSVPQFVLVALHDTTIAWLDGLGLTSRRAAVQAEMAAVMRQIFRNVNIRFVFPGESLPLHLGLASDARFPGGIQALPSVQYAEVVGDDSVPDPEESQSRRISTGYDAGILGRNHAPGEMGAPLEHHALARGLAHRLELFDEVSAIAAEARGGRFSAAQMDRTATMFGRLMGENLAHEVGHFLADQFVAHTSVGVMREGGNRSLSDRSGMTITGAAPWIVDGGRGGINELPADVLRVFEEFLPVNPPIDQSSLRARGRVGSFALVAGRGWVNGARSLSDGEITVHLPGTSVLSGWQARAFVAAAEAAFAAVAGPGLGALTTFVRIGLILDACDAAGATLAVGLSGTGGLGTGGTLGAGIVFAPGHRIGFYGVGGGVVGMIYGIGASIQVTLIDGGPERMEGTGYALGVSVATIGWLDGATVDAPVGLHLLFDSNRDPMGVTFEIGVALGLPIVSLIEAYGQQTLTSTSFGRSFATETETAQPRAAARRAALAEGASPAETEAFLARMIG